MVGHALGIDPVEMQNYEEEAWIHQASVAKVMVTSRHQRHADLDHLSAPQSSMSPPICSFQSQNLLEEILSGSRPQA